MKQTVERCMHPRKTAFLGDSITMGYGLENVSVRFSTVFSQMIGCEEANFGITGTLMARSGTSKTNGSSYVERCSLLPQDADLVVVYGATNDYFWSDTPIDGEAPDDDRVFTHAVRHLCQKLRATYPQKDILFILPYKMRGIGNYFGGTHWRDDHNGHNTDARNYMGYTLADYVSILKDVCREFDVPYLDLYDDFGIDVAHSDDDFETYTLDGCHPNEAGHKRIAEQLYGFCLARHMIAGKEE